MHMPSLLKCWKTVKTVEINRSEKVMHFLNMAFSVLMKSMGNIKIIQGDREFSEHLYQYVRKKCI
jgi:hypothetical protein